MRRNNFFAWYYEEGVHGLLSIWLDFVVFVWRHFSVAELSGTLFAPWHRDVSVRSWRGFDVAKLFGLLVENIFSRAIGALVRLLVIACGIFFTLLVFAAGILALFLWVGLVLVWGMLFWQSVKNGLGWEFSLSFVALSALFVFFAYRRSLALSHLRTSTADIFSSPAFPRLCARLGVLENEFPRNFFLNVAAREEFLRKIALRDDEFDFILSWELARLERISTQKAWWRKENLEKIRPIGTQWKYGYTVKLDHYAHDLWEGDLSEYRDLSFVGREGALEVLNLVLSRSTQNCALLVGPSGIGKKTLIHHLARQIREEKASPYLRRHRLLLVDLARAVSDAVSRGQDVENYVRALLFEAAYAGNVILVVEHLEHYLGAGRGLLAPDLSAVLGEWLEIPTLQLIATSTPKEYHALIEKRSEIARHLEVIELSEPDENETMRIMLEKLEAAEKRSIGVTYGALRSVINQSARSSWQFPLPQRALDLMDDVLTYAARKGELPATEETVDAYLSLKTGAAHGAIGADERKKLLEMEKLLHRQVIGQDEAVRQVAEALRRARSGIADSKKPLGSFLFLGPTGVGKTETAKALAKVYFGSEEAMARLDMSEFSTPAALDRLIGSEHTGQIGRLVSAAKDNPYSLLLLDEIEKAYPLALDIFLQILDEGFVTDAFGEKINMRNMIIIATSNVGAPLIAQMVSEGRQVQDIKQAVVDHAVDSGIFRVELLNRFDDVIFFSPLEGSQLESVVRLQLSAFARRLRKEKNIDVEFDDSVVSFVIEKGYNPMFGARSLARFVRESVEDLVARQIISGQAKPGEKIRISL